MFLSNQLDVLAPILYIIDGALLAERMPKPRPFRSFRRGLAIAMAAHKNLGEGALGLRQMDTDLLRLIHNFT